MDFSANPDSVIVGFDFSGDDMLRGELVTFEQGLTVLYGLNGTGKSRLLRGLRGALLGVQTDVNVSLVARGVVTPALDGQPLFHWEMTRRDQPRPLALALAQELAEPEDFTASPGQRSSERVLDAETVERVIATHIEDTLGDRYPLLLAEVLEDRLFLLSPTGSEAAPGWAAYPVLDPRRPGVSEAYEDRRLLDAKLEADDDFDEYLEGMRGIPLLEDGGHFRTGGDDPRSSPSAWCSRW